MSQCASAVIDGVRLNRRQAIEIAFLIALCLWPINLPKFSPHHNNLPKAEAPATMTEHKIAVSFMIVYTIISVSARLEQRETSKLFVESGGLQFPT